MFSKRNISTTIFSTPVILLSHAVFPAMIASQYTEITLLELGQCQQSMHVHFVQIENFEHVHPLTVGFDHCI
jgi:hypothetical protein